MSSKKKHLKPWGYYINIIEKNDFKIKEICIYPKQQPSYQFHNRRKEYWVIISGVGKSIIDGKVSKVKKGDILKVNKKQKHHLINTSKIKDLRFVEIMMGSYFGEDDIVRVHDLYKRK